MDEIVLTITYIICPVVCHDRKRIRIKSTSPCGEYGIILVLDWLPNTIEDV